MCRNIYWGRVPNLQQPKCNILSSSFKRFPNEHLVFGNYEAMTRQIIFYISWAISTKFYGWPPSVAAMSGSGATQCMRAFTNFTICNLKFAYDHKKKLVKSWQCNDKGKHNYLLWRVLSYYVFAIFFKKRKVTIILTGEKYFAHCAPILTLWTTIG